MTNISKRCCLLNAEQPRCENLSHAMLLSANQMLTCIETNISTHFLKYLYKYVNCRFKNPKALKIKQNNNYTKQEKHELYKELNQEIRDLKSDLINGKIEHSKKRYHKWFEKHRPLLLPESLGTKNSVAYDVKVRPLEYIFHAFYINRKIENDFKKKPYQVIPQRASSVPKNVALDTASMIDILVDAKDKENNGFGMTKTKMISKIKEVQSGFWERIFDMKKKRNLFGATKKYKFFHQIETDGISCSLLFVTKKLAKEVKEAKEEDSFRKIESLTVKERNRYLSDKYKIVSLDPGKIRPISMIDEEGNFFKYSARRWRFETFAKKSIKIINKEQKKGKITEKITLLSKFNSRSLNSKDFSEYVKAKNVFSQETKDFYQKPLFRKLALRRFVRTKQAKHNLLNEIENKYLKNNKKLLILHGDYSRTSQMKGTIPAPNIGFKKLLSKRFEIVDVNEHKTSKLYNKDPSKELVNVRVCVVTRKKKKYKYRTKLLHEILTPKVSTDQLLSRKQIFVNRDSNACKNILMVGKKFLETATRPIAFSRNSNFPN